ncbi:MAG: hypothetical protein UX71_C0001G0080 [Parcubacteria group bacterium GW2011_GWA1_47_10]|uniref:Uncharacterized protein n=1 Tax=Candidatus Gottesmanbacteria bacterium GW2011_GWA2_47_9 TaxID=1618445 RepID=A0A0G1WY79_9BACT|nr:MAG: hypothetical protein UX71_C0001G0080 [Parcubacteria group bacterium GW2011_GWA1_47_10]KKU87165.1 MAG: hypothetical protein UY16_C0036G0007 [Candidatus Gottesmanbacteria bacterium GW2011_GWA2_47_9]KKU97669.1 MAG: hypothetical protein UY30_C0001G0015 [Parcubacteria group bacterium GW2011_GWB1_48_6]
MFQHGRRVVIIPENGKLVAKFYDGPNDFVGNLHDVPQHLDHRDETMSGWVDEEAAKKGLVAFPDDDAPFAFDLYEYPVPEP